MGYTRLAKKIGETYDRVYNMANGRTEPDPIVIGKIRDALGKPPNWPFNEGLKLSEGRLVSLAGTPLAPVPVVGFVAAGGGEYNVDTDEGVIFVPQRLADIGGLGWIVDGDSMMPDLEPNMVALFREYRTPKKDFTFLVKSETGEFRVKNLEWRNGEWTLVSINPSYAPEPLGTHQLVGFLIGWYYAKGTREKMDSDPNGLLLTPRQQIT